MSEREYGTLSTEFGRIKEETRKRSSHCKVSNIYDLPNGTRQEVIEERYSHFVVLVQKKFPDFLLPPLKEILPATEFLFT